MRLGILLAMVALGCGGTPGATGGGGGGGGGGGSGGGGGMRGTGGNGGNGGGGGSGGGIGSGGGGDMAGPVMPADMAPKQTAIASIKNASLRDLTSGNYNLTFIIEDNVYKSGVTNDSLDIMRVDWMQLSWGSEKSRINLACASAPWTSAYPSTSAITIRVNYDAQGYMSYSFPCNSTDSSVTDVNALKMGPSGTVHIAVAGVLFDATAFTAEGDAPIL